MNQKVLMATMEMEIGGAETHILELAKGLAKKGYGVTIVSNGGAYVDELTLYGVTHIKLPLHNKKPWNVYRSYRGIKKIIVEKDIDIVHGHARIPAFICGLIHKKMKFRFVTTAHGVFKTGLLLNYITNWGEKTLSISQDIKEYLMTYYHLSERNIIGTMNGINTKTYHPKNKSSKASGKRAHLVHVSRLEDDTSKVAELLIESLKDKAISNKVDRLTIIGDGAQLKHLTIQSEKVNELFEHPKIQLTGATTEVATYLKEADLFVGISRAALEAMATACPVILAGNPGYQGLVVKERLKEYQANNFTCRGTKELNLGELKGEMMRVLEMDDGNRQSIGADSREIIKSEYSVSKMVEDAIKCYHA